MYLIRHILRSVGLLSNGRRKQVYTVALMLVHVIAIQFRSWFSAMRDARLARHIAMPHIEKYS